jgi:hypothetical protein
MIMITEPLCARPQQAFPLQQERLRPRRSEAAGGARRLSRLEHHPGANLTCSCGVLFVSSKSALCRKMKESTHPREIDQEYAASQ